MTYGWSGATWGGAPWATRARAHTASDSAVSSCFIVFSEARLGPVAADTPDRSGNIEDNKEEAPQAIVAGLIFKRSGRRDSNPGPSGPKPSLGTPLSRILRLVGRPAVL